MRLDIKIQGETLNVTQEILDRYNVPGPRYTSYPTAPEWQDSFGPADYEQAIQQSNEPQPARPLSIYMHLPFCERLCLFCGCNVVINKNHAVAVPYLESLEWEIDQLAQRLDTARPVVQFHWAAARRLISAPRSWNACFFLQKSAFGLRRMRKSASRSIRA
jgi:oxygen-independent coproporphyrinogen-3 oxidase